MHKTYVRWGVTKLWMNTSDLLREVGIVHPVFQILELVLFHKIIEVANYYDTKEVFMLVCSTEGW